MVDAWERTLQIGTPKTVRFLLDQNHDTRVRDFDKTEEDAEWSVVQQGKPLIIGFDEIDSLGNKEINFGHMSPIRCLSRFINNRIVSEKLPCVPLIFSSTSSKATTVFPGHAGSQSATDYIKDPPALTTICLREQFRS